MAGTAYLPWEEWLARILHPLAVAARRWLYQARRRKDLARSQGWREIEGTVHEVKWDSSNPREEVVYSYSTNHGYYSGSCWHWFDRADKRQVQVGNRVLLLELRSGTTSYYQQDGINSVTSLSNPTGALANTYTYDSFGKLTASTGTLTNPFRYTGREFDP